MLVCQLQIIIACKQKPGGDVEDEAKEDEIEAQEMEVNLNSSSVVGIDSLRTMKFTGTIWGKQVLILLDNRATQTLFQIE